MSDAGELESVQWLPEVVGTTDPAEMAARLKAMGLPVKRIGSPAGGIRPHADVSDVGVPAAMVAIAAGVLGVAAGVFIGEAAGALKGTGTGSTPPGKAE